MGRSTVYLPIHGWLIFDGKYEGKVCQSHGSYGSCHFAISYVKLAFFKGKRWVPLGDVPNIYMAYIGQHEGISRKQLGGYSPKGTHIFPLNFCLWEMMLRPSLDLMELLGMVTGW